MTDVEIEYCVPCGHLDRALALQRAVLSALGQDVDRASLVTGDHGVFRVRVDGESVFDAADEAFDVDAVVRDVRTAL